MRLQAKSGEEKKKVPSLLFKKKKTNKNPTKKTPKRHNLFFNLFFHSPLYRFLERKQPYKDLHYKTDSVSVTSDMEVHAEVTKVCFAYGSQCIAAGNCSY